MGRYNYINISPIIIDSVSLENTYALGETINFSSSNLGNTTLKLSSPFIGRTYTYEYEYCALDGCKNYKDQIGINYLTNNSSLIVFDYEYTLDKEAPYALHSVLLNKLMQNFGRIQYLKDNKLVYASIKDVTPNNMKKQVAFETTRDIETSKEVYLSLIIRNKEYTYRIK